MKEIQLLTEKDLEYFRKKQKEGSAVILELSDEDLLRLDFEHLENYRINSIIKKKMLEIFKE
ncbi:hypothetical protein [Ruminococcus sp. 5_1_39BFAA]|uniref:hypothetical protein n=1 Tax=Ruminococcus sp. 5_1_39BFAA TaxID=457412 RepID=UPI0035662F88